MKLKRYVLLNNNMIYDLVVEKDVEKFNTVKNGVQRAYGVKQTSDNILDLVEVGDLITIKIGDKLETHEIVGENFYINHYTRVYLCDITAIYKRQPNGDYKRYEVQK